MDDSADTIGKKLAPFNPTHDEVIKMAINMFQERFRDFFLLLLRSRMRSGPQKDTIDWNGRRPNRTLSRTGMAFTHRTCQ